MTTSTLDCKDFTASEGQYTLKDDIYIETSMPNSMSGTLVSTVSVKYKEYSTYQNSPNADGNSSSGGDRGVGEQQLDIRPTSATESTLVVETEDSLDSERKKPKGNITNSSLVSKIVQSDNLTKILANRQCEDTYLFFNAGRTLFWVDLTNPKDPLSKFNFTKHPICHDVNQLTRSCDHLDVIIGFSSGDVMWVDPFCNKYNRLNKQGLINSSAVTMMKWMPGSDHLFMVSHQDGSIVTYDKDKDDQSFTPTTTTGSEDEGFRVTKPSKNTKHNPVSYWQVSKKAITAFAFSPDCQHVAIVSMEGCLRIIDFVKETYFGGFSCVCWSPDGRYILTGGQDDLVTIWAFREQRIVARCQGHQSWVTAVSFDPWRCDERNYRFGSVGEDTKLLLWDFSVNALHKPKSPGSHRRASLASQSHTTNLVSRRNENLKNTSHLCLPRSEVAILQPVMSKSIDNESLCSITFREDSIITTCRKGHIRLWSRPQLDEKSEQI
ncbi:2620_t:CDS:2 [Diversispora eburnea]|uniref:2620_t:CDS:1 n=2 Tax=Diversisporales TaxID=214509 RepID=A0A9N9FRM3_9GLOM|nr:2620_t:CDS:2 [Diversispora eburnea]